MTREYKQFMLSVM